MTNRVKAALKAFQIADDNWSVELLHVYGNRSGDARYSNKLNGATPRLAELKIERMAAMKEWESAKAENNALVDA